MRASPNLGAPGTLGKIIWPHTIFAPSLVVPNNLVLPRTQGRLPPSVGPRLASLRLVSKWTWASRQSPVDGPLLLRSGGEIANGLKLCAVLKVPSGPWRILPVRVTLALVPIGALLALMVKRATGVAFDILVNSRVMRPCLANITVPPVVIMPISRLV